MALSQDIQDFCTALPTRVSASIAAAVAAAEAQHNQDLADLQTKFDSTLAQVTQDHEDEIAALQAALDQAAPVQPPAAQPAQ